MRLLGVLHRGWWLGLVGSATAPEITDAYYRANGRYADRAYNTSGLFAWEADTVERRFPLNARILVIGAGGGREVIALEQRGYTVEGFECSPQLVEQGNRLLESLHLSSRLAACAPNEVPEVRGFGGAIVGWGAYMHIPGSERRIDFLRRLRAALVPEAPVLLSFFARGGTTCADIWTARFANAIRAIRGCRHDRVEPGDRLEGSFDHHFTRSEIEHELAVAGFGLVEFSVCGYAWAVAVVVSDTARPGSAPGGIQQNSPPCGLRPAP